MVQNYVRMKIGKSAAAVVCALKGDQITFCDRIVADDDERDPTGPLPVCPICRMAALADGVELPKVFAL